MAAAKFKVGDRVFIINIGNGVITSVRRALFKGDEITYQITLDIPIGSITSVSAPESQLI